MKNTHVPESNPFSAKEFSNEYASRNKKVAIQLNEYLFYHGPSDATHVDRRIIGRQKLINKLASLISSAEVATGVYLVSGFRGSGKTSLVNSVVSKFNKETSFLKANYLVFFLIAFSYCFFSLVVIPYFNQILDFHKLVNFFILFLICSCLFVISFLIISRERRRLKMSNNLTFKDYLNLFILKENVYKQEKNKYRYFIYMNLCLVPVAFSSFLVFILSMTGFYRPGYIHYAFLNICVYSFCCLLFVNMVNSIYHKYHRLDGSRWTKILKFIRDITNADRFVFLYLNLGHSKLREIDILRLFARNLQTSIKNYYNKKFILARTLSKMIYILVIYSITYMFYYNASIYNAHETFRTVVGFGYYFPSQVDYYLSADTTEKVDDLYENYSNHVQDFKANNQYDDLQTLYHKNTSTLTQYNEKSTNNNNNIFEHKTVLQYLCENTKSLFLRILAFSDMYVYSIYAKIRLAFFNGFIWGYTSFLGGAGHIPILQEGYRFTLIPFHIDYFFISYFFLTLFLSKWLFIRITFRGKTPKRILRDIDSLNEIIVTEITTERLTYEKSPLNIFTFLIPRTRKRTIADVREIEKGLIDILNDIDQLRFPYSHPRIIVILDELDKIEAHIPVSAGNLVDKKETDQSQSHFIKYPNPSFTIDGTRERQQTLQVLLSNLKYFLSDAKAKFIFISGRELYEASLADISDRNYFMGSIFHDVIYVESFLSEDKQANPSDITSMIEKYVCQFIIPENYLLDEQKKNNKVERGAFQLDMNQKKKASQNEPDTDQQFIRDYSLEKFNKYLLDNEIEGLDDNEEWPIYKRILHRQKREKIINLLQKFVIYLTHASNGAPKKITNYFENFVCSTSFPKTHNILCVSNRKKDFIESRKDNYLVFDYKQQYEIGLINYITLPVVLSVNNHIKNFDDKILVSATYIFDHLLKFHHDGFSWRNIEYVPEILEVNKTPELRNFIGNIINYLSQTHLQVLISGLYNFKYTQRISSEISFLSRISEEASAAFNFTLDESLSIKHYYHSVLHRLEERYSKITTDRTHFINSISLVHSIIGDLYFYDEEYNDAALEYLDSLQFLRYTGIKDEQHGLFLIILRNMLKLGLTYEKRKTFDAAFEVFQELCSILVSYRMIDNEKLGLEEKVNKEKKIILSYPESQFFLNSEDSEIKRSNSKTFKHEIELNTKCKKNFPSENYLKRSDNLFSDATNFISKLTDALNPEIEKILGKIISFEGIRLVYQPLLAKLQIMEKCMIGGITKTDIYRTEKEFHYLQKAICKKEKYMIMVEFYNKLGDILFFKRGNIFIAKEIPAENETSNNRGCHCIFSADFFGTIDSDLQNLMLFKDASSHAHPVDIEIPCASCHCYMISMITFIHCRIDQGILEKLKKRLNGEEVKSPVIILTELFTHLLNAYEDLKSFSQTDLRILAGIISDLGDQFFSCWQWKEKVNYEKIIELLKTLNGIDSKKNGNPRKSQIFINALSRINLTDPDGIVFQYYLSAKLYKKAHESRMYVIQLTKILSIFNDHVDYKNQGDNINSFHLDQNQLAQLNDVLQKAIRGSWQSYENAHMGEIRKHKHIFNSNFNDHRKEKEISLKKISVYTDIEEAVLKFSSILVDNSEIAIERSDYSGNEEIYILSGQVIDFYYLNMVSPYNDLDTIWNRLQRLDFKEKINKKMFMKIKQRLFSNENARMKFAGKGYYEKDRSMAEIIFSIGENMDRFFKSSISGPRFVLFHSDDVKIMRGNDKTRYIQISFSDLLSHLIAESIFCLNEILEVSNAYGKSFTNNHSFFGDIHERFSFWAVYYEILNVGDIQNKLINEESFNQFNNDKIIKWFLGLKEKVNKNLENSMDEDSLNTLSMVYHYEMAIRRYYSAIETHQEGKSYSQLIENMCYLNDDFNDKISHYKIAAERRKINTGDILRRISDLKKAYIGSKLYDYDAMITTVF